ncbi:hypothetical protein [Pedobacter sp. MW01-1-1]|uniref:hypothetical protein n=1 Tax=Pedobacter sp. MW01-1-1 TaxID=3383027 RepID=UPI003FEEBEE7
MKYLILISLCLITWLSVSCQEKKINTQNNINERPISQPLNKEVNVMLKKQLEYGKPSFDNPYEYSEDDLEITTPILNQLLMENGYKVIKNDEFNDKIKLIFKRIIDRNSQSNFLYINFLDKCDKRINYFPNDAENFGFFVIKKFNIIAELYPLPAIIDYQKVYPNEAQKENAISKTYQDANGYQVDKYLWKDVANLKEIRKRKIQTLVARNMYLFNDNKAQYKWLILHDEYFMGRLVKTFGYTQDLDLLKWVIEKTKFNKNNPKDYGSLFWTKQCDGILKIHSNTFKILQKLQLPNDPSENKFILENIKGYLEYLGSNEASKYENLTQLEKIKIMANLAYFAEQYKYKKEYESNLRIMGSLRYFFNDESRAILKKNNYFGLPKFKEWWDKADFDEYYMEGEYNGFWGTVNRPLGENEWREQNAKEN